VAFSSDRWILKAIGYVVFVLEVAQTIIKAADQFELNVKSYTNPLILDDQFRAWFSIPVLSELR
jgi:hypothetical protein